MRFDTSIVPASLPAFARRVRDLVPPRRWEGRAESLISRCRECPELREFLAQRYALELGVFDLLIAVDKGTPLQWSEPRVFQAASFMAMLAMVYQRLADRPRNQLRGALARSLNDRAGLRPLAFELATAARFMRAGFDVTFADYEQLGTFDLLLQQAETTVEVECKVLFPEKGRKIVHEAATILLAPLKSTILKFLGGRAGVWILDVDIEDRLPERRALQSDLHARVARALHASADTSGVRLRDAGSSMQDLLTLPEAAIPEAVRVRFIDSNVENSSFALFCRAANNQCCLIVLLRSIARASAMQVIEDHLLDSSRRQFSKDRPAVLCVELAELPAGSLLQLAEFEGSKISSLQLVANRVLHRRPYLVQIEVVARGQPAERALPYTRALCSGDHARVYCDLSRRHEYGLDNLLV
jgi:hypothetical protein